jgi:hypothetical protein
MLGCRLLLLPMYKYSEGGIPDASSGVEMLHGYMRGVESRKGEESFGTMVKISFRLLLQRSHLLASASARAYRDIDCWRAWRSLDALFPKLHFSDAPPILVAFWLSGFQNDARACTASWHLINWPPGLTPLGARESQGPASSRKGRTRVEHQPETTPSSQSYDHLQNGPKHSAPAPLHMGVLPKRAYERCAGGCSARNTDSA